MNRKRNRFFVTLGAGVSLCGIAGRLAAADAMASALVANKGCQTVMHDGLSVLFPDCIIPLLFSGSKYVASEHKRRYFVIGQIGKSGAYPVPEGKEFRVIDALTEAGGATGRGEQRRVEIRRLVNGKPTMLKVNLLDIYNKGLTAENYLIQDQDVIFIPGRSVDNSTGPFLNPLFTFSSLYNPGLFH